MKEIKVEQTIKQEQTFNAAQLDEIIADLSGRLAYFQALKTKLTAQVEEAGKIAVEDVLK